MFHFGCLCSTFNWYFLFVYHLTFELSNQWFKDWLKQPKVSGKQFNWNLFVRRKENRLLLPLHCLGFFGLNPLAAHLTFNKIRISASMGLVILVWMLYQVLNSCQIFDSLLPFFAFSPLTPLAIECLFWREWKYRFLLLFRHFHIMSRNPPISVISCTLHKE